MSEAHARETFHTIVVGGGQAGLSVGYYLARQGRPFVILDASQRIGDPWRHRWDSLRLFTPALFDGLVGMKFPASPFTFPTKDEMANYLEAYARHFSCRFETAFESIVSRAAADIRLTPVTTASRQTTISRCRATRCRACRAGKGAGLTSCSCTELLPNLQQRAGVSCRRQIQEPRCLGRASTRRGSAHRHVPP